MSTIPTTEAYLKQAIAQQLAGEFDAAERGYLEILRLDPQHSEAQHNMGAMVLQRGVSSDALPYFLAALEIDPSRGQYWISYIDALLKSGQMEAARQVLALAVQQGLQGEEVDALSLQAQEIAPHSPVSEGEPSPQEQQTLLALFNAGRQAEAAVLARRMTLDYPLCGVGWKVLGAVTASDQEALLPMQHAASLCPDDFEVHYNLGLILQALGRLEEAVASYRWALQLNPDYAPGYNNLGVTLQELGRLEEAEGCYRRAVEIKPDYVNAHHNLGIVLQCLNRFEQAESIHLKTLQLKPDHAEAHCNLGIVLLSQGKNDEAVKSFRRALQIKPDFVVAHSNLIFCLDMAQSVNLSQLQQARQEWDERHAARFWHATMYRNERSAHRPLRIGYVSADFRNHSASKAFGAMLTRYDRGQFEVFAYDNYKGVGDKFTELFRGNVTVWRDISALSDDEAAQLIREDQIDILVDLSGHSAGNRLLVFARKPAPVQISAFGYAAGTGMRAMDVLFSDPVMIPPDEKCYYREQVRYLPCVLGLFSTDQFPDVNELPALGAGAITFGSFNRLAKLTEKTFLVWAQILLALPESRLILKTPELNDASTLQHIVGRFSSLGVESGRVVLLGRTSWYEHMCAYRSVDIALDPFPHGGGMTAVEGLMMGVPVVTLCWPTLTGRISASIMTTLALPEWIAQTERQYIDIALDFAANLPRLSKLRQQLRRVLCASVIGNQDAYVAAVEQQYRALWREWCASNGEAN
ncbi:MAG: tetratricopeptide repeat protein [Nitrosomonadales bacterium]